eukprot:TRINITY_DN4233_c0_g1_i25.p1 TRINITY_DN4233_c0_g1~~TRINITY_DN4233_c0_g1_i25.p1  ORF type:complete len:373 (-),score=93.71 TRINITY_DN4233_c0_g1_i25:255-1373(-)
MGSYFVIHDGGDIHNLNTGVKDFLDFSRSEYSSENLLFIMAVMRFKTLFPSVNPIHTNELVREANLIYMVFIHEQSKTMVNLSGPVQQGIHKGFSGGLQYNPDIHQNIFNTALEETIVGTGSDPFQRFLSTPLGIKWANFFNQKEEEEQKKKVKNKIAISNPDNSDTTNANLTAHNLSSSTKKIPGPTKSKSKRRFSIQFTHEKTDNLITEQAVESSTEGENKKKTNLMEFRKRCVSSSTPYDQETHSSPSLSIKKTVLLTSPSSPTIAEGHTLTHDKMKVSTSCSNLPDFTSESSSNAAITTTTTTTTTTTNTSTSTSTSTSTTKPKTDTEKTLDRKSWVINTDWVGGAPVIGPVETNNQTHFLPTYAIRK